MREEFDQVISSALRSTVPIYGVQNGEVKHDRTGVLYSVAGSHFILTASHVGQDGGDLRDLIRAGIPWFIPTVQPIHLLDAQVLGTEVDGRDLAAIQITDMTHREIVANGWQFLSHNRVSFNDDGTGFYMVCGFPMAWTGKKNCGKYGSDPLTLLGETFSGDMPENISFDDKVHMAIGCDTECALLGSGEPVELPELAGVSGCGIWRIGSAGGGHLKVSPSEPTLVGIENRWIKKKTGGAVFGTRIQHVMRRILDDCEDLVLPMSIVYPERID